MPFYPTISEGLNRGAQFTVRLPLVANAKETVGEASGQNNVFTQFKSKPPILVADDNRDAAESLAILLRAEGFPVSVAFNGTSALAAFDSVHPAVTVLDMAMPDMSGAEVARHIRSRPAGATIKIITITGWGPERDREAHGRRGLICIW